MKIFSGHRKKIEAKKRFGGLEFRSKVRDAANYKRVFSGNPKISLKAWRNISVALLIVVIYFTVFSNYFVIANIEVKGNSQVSTQDIVTAIKSGSNPRIFFLTAGRVNKLLVSKLPAIKSVSEYHRDWPNKISLTVKERNPGFVIESNSKYFLVDEDGIVISSIEDPANKLVVHDQLVEDFGTNEALTNNKFAPFVLSMTKQWPSKVSPTIKTIKFPGKASNEIQFETTAGWSVWFDTTRPVIGQLSTLAVILNKKISLADQAKLAYIDLRLAKYAYYCFKETACQQQPAEAGTQTDAQQVE